MLHQSWTSFSGEEQEEPHFQPDISLAAHLGFNSSGGDEEGSDSTFSAVACDIAERVGGVAMDYIHALNDRHHHGGIPQYHNEESSSSDTDQEREATSPTDWKRYISAQVNRLRDERFPSAVPTADETPPTNHHHAGYCKEVHDLPV